MPLYNTGMNFLANEFLFCRYRSKSMQFFTRECCVCVCSGLTSF